MQPNRCTQPVRRRANHIAVDAAHAALERGVNVPEVMMAVVISTAHIPQQVADQLVARTGWATELAYADWMGMGFILHVPGPGPQYVPHMLPEGTPESLEDVFQWADARGFTYVMLDRDADTVPELPVYDW